MHVDILFLPQKTDIKMQLVLVQCVERRKLQVNCKLLKEQRVNMQTPISEKQQRNTRARATPEEVIHVHRSRLFSKV